MKTIQEFPNYQISRDGKIWSKPRIIDRLRYGKIEKLNLRGKWLKPKIDGGGYFKVALSKNGKTYEKKIHRLLAQTYISNPKNKPEINHKNSIKTDNHVSNIEWCTRSENLKHAWKNGLRKSVKGENGSNAKLTWKDIKEIRQNHIPKNGKPWEKYEIVNSTYYSILNNKTWYDSEYKKGVKING